jgi:hypothetical protein
MKWKRYSWREKEKSDQRRNKIMKTSRKYSIKPISLYDEIELLSQFPFGGLIGGEMLPHDLPAIETKKDTGQSETRETI